MRLISIRPHDFHLQMKEFGDENTPPYAILSHRWQKSEVSFQEMQRPASQKRQRYNKIKQCCAVAVADGIHHLWIDTCCIDKTSSTELSEAINSMYRWYQQAKVCYAFLADIEEVDEISRSQWFTRGWTLQELIAPRDVVFYNKNWTKLGRKDDLKQIISSCTGIAVNILDHTTDLESVCVAQRMSWAAKRKTTRLEDQAYCLLGIFGINMPMLYGEGKNAFVRLQEEILKSSSDESIFAWKSNFRHHSGFLADSPRAFEDCADITLLHSSSTSNVPWSVTNKGLRLEIRFMAVGPRGLGLAILDCQKGSEEDGRVAIYMRDPDLTLERFERARSHEIKLLNMQQYTPSLFPRRLAYVDKRRLAIAEIDCYDPFLCFDEIVSIGTSDENSQVIQTKGGINQADRKGRTPLYHAVRGDNFDAFTSLLAKPEVNVHAFDQNGRTALFYAAELGYLEMVWLLLAKRNSNPNARDNEGRAPLSHAAEGGHTEMVWLLLTRNDVDGGLMDRRGYTPLSYAARAGKQMIIRIIMTHFGLSDNVGDGTGRTILSHAADCEQEATVKMLLLGSEIGCDVEDDKGRTALSWATASGQDTIIEILLAHGSDINAKDHRGRTPIWYAVAEERLRTTTLLLKHHALVKTTSWNRVSPFSFGRDLGGRIDLIKLLLSNGATIEPNDLSGNSILTWAAENHYRDLIELLLCHGIDIEAEDRHERTPLAWAASRGDEIFARQLLSHILNKSTEESVFWAPLYLAVRNGHDKVVALLLDHGAPLDLSYEEPDNTLLHIAAENGHDKIFDLLLSRGANPDTFGPGRERLICWVARKGWENYARVLLSYGADPNASNRASTSALMLTKKQEIANLLLEYGADPNGKDKYGRTAGDRMKKKWHCNRGWEWGEDANKDRR